MKKIFFIVIILVPAFLFSQNEVDEKESYEGLQELINFQNFMSTINDDIKDWYYYQAMEGPERKETKKNIIERYPQIKIKLSKSLPISYEHEMNKVFKSSDSLIFYSKKIMSLLNSWESYQDVNMVTLVQRPHEEIAENYETFTKDVNGIIVNVKIEYSEANAAKETKSKIIKFGLVFLSILILCVMAFLYFIVKSKKKVQIQKQEITLQRDELKFQKHLVEEKHREITDSINYAERIQRSFLATKEQLDEQLKDYFVLFQPKDVVSGDFYWAHTLRNGNFALVTADSTGHGVPGAIMSLLNTSSLEKAVELGINEPAEILNHTRQTIIERLKKDGSAEGGKDGMDCSLISFNKEKTKLVYAAANNPIWIIRNNELIELKSDKMPVGKHDRDSVSFTQHEVELQKGDMIYALTDGFPDQFGGPKGKKFMYKKLKELLISIAHQSSKEQQSVLRDTLKDWMGHTEQVDDVTVIGVRV